MDEAINLLRRYWSEESVSANSQFYQFEAIAMEPKPPQGGKLPIWIGGSADATMKRVGELGDGWLATSQMRDAEVVASKSKILEYAEAAGRDVSAIGFQMMLDTPPNDEAGKGFYADKEKVFAAAERIKGFGFEWMAINMTAIFQAGARSVEELVEQVADVHDALRERFD
tara:strand:- start:329 stop:838 length:510 start_codon:yes stop_codon:yes gene_type:complete